MTTPANPGPGPGPRSGDDTYDLTGDALAKLAERRGAWLGDDLTAITLLASLIDQARTLPARAGHQRPPEQAHLGRDCPRACHQPRRGPPAVRPRIPGHRPAMALRPLARKTRYAQSAEAQVGTADTQNEARTKPGTLHYMMIMKNGQSELVAIGPVDIEHEAATARRHRAHLRLDRGRHRPGPDRGPGPRGHRHTGPVGTVQWERSSGNGPVGTVQ